MPRSSSRSSSSSRGSGSGGMFGGSKAAPAAPAHKPAPVHHAAPAAPHAPAPIASHPPAPVMAAPQPRGLMGTIMEGMAFGTGSAIAHRAVGAVAGSMFGGSDNKEQAAAPVAAAAAPAAPASTATFAGRGQDCAPFQQEFVKCLQENKNDIASCQMYMDNFNQCQVDNKLA